MKRTPLVHAPFVHPDAQAEPALPVPPGGVTRSQSGTDTEKACSLHFWRLGTAVSRACPKAPGTLLPPEGRFPGPPPISPCVQSPLSADGSNGVRVHTLSSGYTISK